VDCRVEILKSGATEMTLALEAFGVDQLSALERLELIELIWDSLPDRSRRRKSRRGAGTN
jgi:hypothetical protein